MNRNDETSRLADEDHLCDAHVPRWVRQRLSKFDQRRSSNSLEHLWVQIQTHKRINRTLFIRTKHK